MSQYKELTSWHSIHWLLVTQRKYFESNRKIIKIVCQLLQYCHVVYRVLKSQLNVLILIMLCLVNISLCYMCFRGLNCVLSVCLGLIVFNSCV